MDILEIAMKMEIDGQQFYLKGADQASNKELKKIYQTLADEEDRHLQIFRKMKESDLATASKLVSGPSPTVKLAKNIFQELSDKGVTSLGNESEKSVWTDALRLEEQAVEMYSGHAKDEKDAERKTLWERIADEERNHVHLISNIISFMVDPSGYAQSAQFSNFMSWEGHWED